MKLKKRSKEEQKRLVKLIETYGPIESFDLHPPSEYPAGIFKICELCGDKFEEYDVYDFPFTGGGVYLEPHLCYKCRRSLR